MHTATPTKEDQILQMASAGLLVWAAISILGHIIDHPGPEIFWDVFGGTAYPSKILFIPIPDFITNFLYGNQFFGLFDFNQVLTIATGAVAVVYLASRNRMMIRVAAGLAVLNALLALLFFVDLVTNSLAREYIGVFGIFRGTVITAIVPLLMGLILASLEFANQVPFLVPIRQQILGGAGAGVAAAGPAAGVPTQGFSTNIFSDLNKGATMSNESPQPQTPAPSTGFAAPPPSSAGYSAFDLTTPLYRVQVMGAGDRLYAVGELQQMAKQKVLKPDTMVQHRDAGYPVQASTVPNVFSDKQWVTALLLSFFLGALGVDRFYLGHTGIGIAKLLTLGGCGVWSLIDFILIAMRNVTDAQGRPLA